MFPTIDAAQTEEQSNLKTKRGVREYPDVVYVQTGVSTQCHFATYLHCKLASIVRPVFQIFARVTKIENLCLAKVEIF
jgi:hypothetical protein